MGRHFYYYGHVSNLAGMNYNLERHVIPIHVLKAYTIAHLKHNLQ